jgi:hypothetical protein
MSAESVGLYPAPPLEAPQLPPSPQPQQEKQRTGFSFWRLFFGGQSDDPSSQLQKENAQLRERVSLLENQNSQTSRRIAELVREQLPSDRGQEEAALQTAVLHNQQLGQRLTAVHLDIDMTQKILTRATECALGLEKRLRECHEQLDLSRKINQQNLEFQKGLLQAIHDLTLTNQGLESNNRVLKEQLARLDERMRALAGYAQSGAAAPSAPPAPPEYSS